MGWYHLTLAVALLILQIGHFWIPEEHDTFYIRLSHDRPTNLLSVMLAVLY